jgi:CRISPR system Cascade subunit CasC
MEKLFIDFHVLQTVPPSCVNRDDTGSPKTAVYGGVRRARVSSQAWKRAMRTMFRDHFDEAELGVRTKRIVELVAAQIIALDASLQDTALDTANNILNVAAVTTAANKKTGIAEAKALFFMSAWQAKNLAELAIAGETDKKKVQAALNRGNGVDIALFGRMVADDPSLNADASSQVAHSISTHAVENEYDYFTAVDDKSPDDNAGAGMIGNIEFNSATLYRYATVAVHELRTQLGDDADALAKAVSEFARAFITSMPTGKQNTFANRTLPSAVLVTLRRDQPINFAGAFENPVRAGGGYAEKSVAALSKYVDEIYADFADKPEKTYVVGNGLDGAGERVNLGGLYTALADDVRSRAV